MARRPRAIGHRASRPGTSTGGKLAGGSNGSDPNGPPPAQFGSTVVPGGCPGMAVPARGQRPIQGLASWPGSRPAR